MADRERLQKRWSLLSIAGETWEAFALRLDPEYPGWIVYRIGYALVWHRMPNRQDRRKAA